MAQPSQTYKTHVRWLPPFHFFVLPVLLVNVLYQSSLLYADPSVRSAWAFMVATALFMLGVLSRVQANKVQDRVIRLEMHLRLREILPDELKGHIRGLMPNQLVALRFAGDAELPDLVRDVIAGRLSTPKAIKMRIRDWQGDWLRA